MTLDQRPSDAELLARLAALNAKADRARELGSHRALALAQRLSNRAPAPSPSADAADPARPRKLIARIYEHHLQVALFDLVNADAEQERRPELALVFAVPNGGMRTVGVAAKLKAEGVKPGPPDVWCPVPRGGYCGLVIEMKRPGGTTSPEQRHWLTALAREGWKTALHTTTEGAWAELCTYLDMPPTEMSA